MTVELAPPITGSPATPHSSLQRAREAPVPLTHGPALARTRGMGRWHRVRSGLHFPERAPHPDAARYGWSTDTTPAFTVWSFWCGPHASTAGRPRRGHAPGVLTLDELPDDDGVPLCGTCEGRAVGAGYPPIGTVVTAPGGLIFAPRDLTTPDTCPGTGGRLYVDVPGTRLSDCLVCGDRVGWWGRGLRRHPPGPDLVPGCPQHAWRSLVVVDDTVVCACRTYYDRGE